MKYENKTKTYQAASSSLLFFVHNLYSLSPAPRREREYPTMEN